MSLAVVGAVLDDAVVGLRAVDGLIAALGPDVVAQPGDDVLDAAGLTLAPGMVNAHTHAAMSLFRGYGDDLPLQTWLQERIWPAEAKLTEDDVYWGTRLACLEMIRSGTTRFVDMYWFGTAVARAAIDAGLRAAVSAVLLDGGLDAPKTRRMSLRDDASRSLDELIGLDPLIEPMLGPHAIYTVSEESLAWVGRTARERGVGVHIHLSETRHEVDDCIVASGVRPTMLLSRCGVLGPRTIVAHGCWLDPDEIEVLAATDTTIATLPVSNMKLAVGRNLPYREAHAAGVRLGLGTDGAGSNNGLDMFQDVKVLALHHKFHADDPSVLPAPEALAVARGQRSPVLAAGMLAVGAPADFLLLRTDEPELTPGDLTANLVYAATGHVVDTTVVAGRVLMRGRQVDGAREVVAEARDRAAQLTGA